MKTRKIESFNYKTEVMFPLQGTDPNKNPKHLKYGKWCWAHHSVVHPLKSEISLAVRQLPELLQAHPTVTRLQRYLVANLKARYLSVLIGMNPEEPDFKIHQSINAPRKENWTRHEFQQPGHSAGIFSGAGCSQHRPEPAATGSATDFNLLNLLRIRK